MAALAMMTADSSERGKYREFLATVPIISTLAAVDIDRLADMVTSVSFADGDVIMAQDDIGDAMYILHTGETGAYLKLPKAANQSAEPHVDKPAQGGLFVTVMKSGAKGPAAPLDPQVLGTAPRVQMDRAPPLDEVLKSIGDEQAARAKAGKK